MHTTVVTPDWCLTRCAREELVKHQSGVTTVVCIVLLGGCGRRGSTPATSSSQNPPAAGISRASPAETAATNRATSDSAIRAGWMISTAYRISVVGAHDTQVVRFEQLMGRDPRGGAIVRVLDTLVVPPLHSPERSEERRVGK